jgi:diguanylate cyclase (GGDEF)-like protein
VLAAGAVARNQSQQSRQGFVTSAQGIASNLQLAIQHEQDLVFAVGTYVVLDPQASQSTFQSWVRSAMVFQRYPEVIGIADLSLVPASQLSQFAARSVADPAGPLGSDGTFQVIPSGSRAYYCLANAIAAKTISPTPAGFDYCDSPLGAAFLKARDSGEAAYFPYKTGKTSVLVLGAPLYSGGGDPDSVTARRATFVGWTGTSIVPGVILSSALVGHPSTSLAFRYRSNGYSAAFKAGTAPGKSQSTTITLKNGWSVQIIGIASGGGIIADPNALALLISGIAFFLLSAAILYLMATSRSQALEMVRVRTAELRHTADKLRNLAFHDSLTGLPNRSLILDRVDAMLKRSRRNGTCPAALFLDLDDFKDINDTLGHEAGDELLIKVAGRLTSALRDGDSIGRLGGDEFVVLVDGSTDESGPEAVAQRVLDALIEPITIASSPQPLQVTASIGIAKGADVTPAQLLKDADIALYRAKNAGKHRAVVFSRSMQESVEGHRRMELDLHHALENHEFFVVYQPTVDLATGTFTGVEALVRWNHPKRGILEPDAFIPSLEVSGLIVPVGQWVLETSCRQGALWQSRGLRTTVAVNVSAVQLERDRIVEVVRRALAVSRLDPSLLVLEITETAIMRDVESTLVLLNELKVLGVGIAIDDFGTGYSSLAYLRQFPIDVMKIDQSFVGSMADSPESAAVVHTMVQLGKVLGLKTIAEGVENNEQLVRLRAEGVDLIQGFLFARPMGVAEAGRLLGTAPVAGVRPTAPVDGPVDDESNLSALERGRVGQRQ